MRSLFLCLSLAIAPLGGSAFAKEHTFRIVFLGAPDNAPEELYLFDGKASQKVKLPQWNLSPVYKLPEGALELRLVAKSAAKVEEIPAGTPKAALAADVDDFFLLVTSDPSNAVMPVRLSVIDAGAAKFKKGGMMWYNLTPHTLAGTVGAEKLAMGANSRTVIGAPATARGDYAVHLTYQKSGDPRTFPLADTKWAHNPDARNLIFVFNQPGSIAPRVLGFLDERQPEDKADAPR